MCVCFSEKAEPVASLNANPPNSDLVALAPTPSAPPPTLALVSRQMGDSKPPQAIVKPQILTHIIEGFVIQEGAEPFPVRAGPAWKWGWEGRGDLIFFFFSHIPLKERKCRTIPSLENGSLCAYLEGEGHKGSLWARKWKYWEQKES